MWDCTYVALWLCKPAYCCCWLHWPNNRPEEPSRRQMQENLYHLYYYLSKYLFFVSTLKWLWSNRFFCVFVFILTFIHKFTNTNISSIYINSQILIYQQIILISGVLLCSNFYTFSKYVILILFISILHTYK